VVGTVQRVNWIHRRNHTPVAVLVHEPPSWPQTFDHSVEGGLLFASELEEYETATHEIKRTGRKHVQRVFENVVANHFEVWQLKSVEVAKVNIGCDYPTGRTYLMSQPHRH
jgi:hypothetical protein